MNNYFKIIRNPKKCILDNATYFQNERFKIFAEQNQVLLIFTGVRHPESNPSERHIQEILKFKKIIVQGSHTFWYIKLESVELYLNIIPNTVTGETTLYLTLKIDNTRK